MKKFKRLSFLLLTAALVGTVMTGCDNSTDNGTDDTTTFQQLQEDSSTSDTGTGNPVDDAVSITFNGTSYQVNKKGVLQANGNILTITEPGKYRLSGTLSNAQLCVEIEKTESIELVFAGVNITNQTSAPIYIKSADKVYIELAAGTENVLTDAKTYIFPAGEDKPNACLYSSEDIIFSGTGSLTVNANYNNGIGSKNDIKIKNGTITVVSANNALKGNDSVKIQGGNVTLTGMDGIKSDSIEESKGIVEITGGTVAIYASDDGIQAENGVNVTAGAKVTVKANDQDVNCNNTYNVTIAQGALITQ